MPPLLKETAEALRLASDATREQNWKRWGPYLSERQWGTVREDYSGTGECWEYFPHDHARSRAYRWGEDGLLGMTDREGRLCFALALWNGKDAILKERLFGLTNAQGNHGEDVKEVYYYLDSTPTHSYFKGLYKYPQAAFPYEQLVAENARRSNQDREFELIDTGVFDESRYFDVTAEYAKGSPDDILIKITVANRGPEAATIDLLPTFWFRNTWIWGCAHEGCTIKPRIVMRQDSTLVADHPTLGRFVWQACPASNGVKPVYLFTENETNTRLLYGVENYTTYVRDAFHRFLVDGDTEAINPRRVGTKVAASYRLEVPAGGEVSVRLRLRAEELATDDAFSPAFDRIFAERIAEADAFHTALIPPMPEDARRVMRQAYAGLLWSKQFYHYIVEDWLYGDPEMPAPPPERLHGRNAEWSHLFNRDIISMPDKWEYPWYAAWDLAFHMIPFARLDPHFAKEQLILFLREWYMRPNGQIPAYEFALGDVNPPVHAWACWRVYKITAPAGERDVLFLQRCFHKLLINFTWWVNRKDDEGRNLFAGGFLGLDNIGVFDRSKPLPTGGYLQQADGTAWMAFYCLTMLAMALELARTHPAYEDVASKFFEHFVDIADAMNTLGGTGLWNETDGFYYDRIRLGEDSIPLKVRSMVGLLPLCAVAVLDDDDIEHLPGFRKRLDWYMRYRPDLARNIAYMERDSETAGGPRGHRLLAIPSKERLVRTLHYMLDENDFLSPYGIRSLSRVHADQPYVFRFGGEEHRVEYVPGESNTWVFGGNSNWRGPIWFPVNFILIEALERFDHFYGDTLLVECPTGSGNRMRLRDVAREIERRLSLIFLAGEEGRPCNSRENQFADDPHWRDLILFHEYFNGDTGEGLGANHQTGWTALIAPCLRDIYGQINTEPKV